MAAVYLDSCIVIYLIEEEPAIRTRLGGLLRNPFADGRIRLSPLTRLECRVLPLRQQDKALLAKYDFFFRHSGARLIAMTKTVFDQATALRATYRLKTADALHLAVAIVGGCDEFWTNDDRLAKAAAGQVRVVKPLG